MLITLCAVAHAFHTASSIEPRSVLTRRSAVAAGISLPGARALRKLRGRGGASGPITAAEVEAAQDAWAAGVVHVGKVFSDSRSGFRRATVAATRGDGSRQDAADAADANDPVSIKKRLRVDVDGSVFNE